MNVINQKGGFRNEEICIDVNSNSGWDICDSSVVCSRIDTVWNGVGVFIRTKSYVSIVGNFGSIKFPRNGNNVCSKKVKMKSLRQKCLGLFVYIFKLKVKGESQ